MRGGGYEGGVQGFRLRGSDILVRQTWSCIAFTASEKWHGMHT